MKVTPPAPEQGAWSSSLFDCCTDGHICCLTWFCPCVSFGRVAEIVDRGSTSCWTAGGQYTLLMMFTLCQPIYSCTYRTKMRNQYDIPGSEIRDFFTHFCCELCALTQMYRELIARGYDVSLGWNGNIAAKQNQGVTMAPVAPGGMSR